MQCYECTMSGTAREAVAVCWSCSAGLCLSHLREAAAHRSVGAIRPACAHDTWTAKGMAEPSRVS